MRKLALCNAVIAGLSGLDGSVDRSYVPFGQFATSKEVELARAAGWFDHGHEIGQQGAVIGYVPRDIVDKCRALTYGIVSMPARSGMSEYITYGPRDLFVQPWNPRIVASFDLSHL